MKKELITLQQATMFAHTWTILFIWTRSVIRRRRLCVDVHCACVCYTNSHKSNDVVCREPNDHQTMLLWYLVPPHVTKVNKEICQRWIIGCAQFTNGQRMTTQCRTAAQDICSLHFIWSRAFIYMHVCMKWKIKKRRISRWDGKPFAKFRLHVVCVMCRWSAQPKVAVIFHSINVMGHGVVFVFKPTMDRKQYV